MRSKIERYYLQREKNILLHLHEFETAITETGLHDFRVELKKLRALLRFLQEVHGKQEVKKIRKAVDTVFQEAGTLREQQLFVLWLHKNRLNKLKRSYADEHLLPEISGALQKILKAIRKKISAVLEQNKKLVAATAQSITEAYAAKLKHRVEKQLLQEPAEAEWHELRKLLKQWLYSVNWIEKQRSTSLSQLYRFSDQLQEAIGNWHDAIHIHITLLTMKGHLPKDLKIQKDHTTALQKITATIKQTAAAVQQLLEHPGPAAKRQITASPL